MQTQPQSHIEDERDPAVHILEQETGDFKALIDEIWCRFTERVIEMQRRSSGFQIDPSVNQ